MKTFREFLIEREACDPASEWAGDMTVEEVVEKCHRGDWLLWLAEEVRVEKHLLVLAGGLSANTVRHLMKDERSKNAVDVYIRYGQGHATDEELNAAMSDARIAWFDADDEELNTAEVDAAEAVRIATLDAWEAARIAARAAEDELDNQKKTADIAREVCGNQIIQLVNQLLQ